MNDQLEMLRGQIAEFGFCSIRGFIASDLLIRLQEEAGEALQTARHGVSTAGLLYSASMNSLQPHAALFLSSREMVGLLLDLFNAKFALTEGRSCTTYYSEDDHLAPHLDTPAEECVVTIIVYLKAAAPDFPSPETGLMLNIYGDGYPGDDRIKLRIPTEPGTIVLGRGSRTWHGRPRLQPGEHVIALTGCYSEVENAQFSRSENEGQTVGGTPQPYRHGYF
jgi:hypothetical protein